MRQTKRADFVAGDVVLVAQLFRYLETRFAMCSQEMEEVLAFYEIYLARIDRLSRQLVSLSGDGCAQAQDFAGFRDFEDQRLAVGRANREFYASLAEHENAPRRLAFNEQDRALRIRRRVFDIFKRLQRLRRQVAKNAVGPHLARQAAFDNVKSVR